MTSYAGNLRYFADGGINASTTVLRGAAAEIEDERALADELAAALDHVPEHLRTPEADAVLARYREARR